MAFFPLNEDGKPDDRVRLELDDTLVITLQSYVVSQQFLTVPSAFSATIGDGDSVIELITSYPPKTPYRLLIGEVPQHTGELDGAAADGGGEGTVVNLNGRDGLALLHDAHATADKGFGNLSYADLASACIDGAGYGEYTLFTSNDANRRVQGGLSSSTQVAAPKNPDGARVGATVVAAGGVDPNGPEAKLAQQQANAAAKLTGQSITVVLGAPTSITDQIASQTAAFNRKTTSAKSTAKKLQIKLGDTWYGFFKKEADRAGLFIFAGVDKDLFVLTEPNAKQKPTYRLYRKRGLDRNEVNVLSHKHHNRTEGRHARYIVVGRGGSGKGGREKVRGEFVDQEMVDFGYVKPWAKEDAEAKSAAQCEFYARRACAEARRQGWELVYTVEGHTAPSLVGNGRAVWAIDTIVDVQDDELGIYGPHWIEGVALRGGPSGTTTEITLMRPEDLVFGEGVFLAPKVPKKKGGRRRGSLANLRGQAES